MLKINNVSQLHSITLRIYIRYVVYTFKYTIHFLVGIALFAQFKFTKPDLGENVLGPLVAQKPASCCMSRVLYTDYGQRLSCQEAASSVRRAHRYRADATPRRLESPQLFVALRYFYELSIATFFSYNGVSFSESWLKFCDK